MKKIWNYYSHLVDLDFLSLNHLPIW